jgi:hypothetical protein
MHGLLHIFFDAQLLIEYRFMLSALLGVRRKKGPVHKVGAGPNGGEETPPPPKKEKGLATYSTLPASRWWYARRQDRGVRKKGCGKEGTAISKRQRADSTNCQPTNPTILQSIHTHTHTHTYIYTHSIPWSPVRVWMERREAESKAWRRRVCALSFIEGRLQKAMFNHRWVYGTPHCRLPTHPWPSFTCHALIFKLDIKMYSYLARHRHTSRQAPAKACMCWVPFEHQVLLAYLCTYCMKVGQVLHMDQW